jgi:hypothetical protein
MISRLLTSRNRANMKKQVLLLQRGRQIYSNLLDYFINFQAYNGHHSEGTLNIQWMFGIIV